MPTIIDQNTDLNGLPCRGVCRLSQPNMPDPWRHISHRRTFRLGRWSANGCEVTDYADDTQIRPVLTGATYLTYSEVQSLTGSLAHEHSRDDFHFWLNVAASLEGLWPINDDFPGRGAGNGGMPPPDDDIDCADDGQPALSVFAGTGDIIDQWLGPNVAHFGQAPHYRHRRAFLEMLQPPGHAAFNGADLVKRLLAQITRNWQDSQLLARRRPSRENWRFRKELFIAPANTSLEKQLEKMIARFTDDDWANQIPTASGLLNAFGRQHNIDLAHRRGQEFWLYELKWESDNPLSAAMQILLYGTLYLFWRLHLQELNCDLNQQPLLTASAMRLRVLAPRAYYETPNHHGSLEWLETCLSAGLQAVAQEQDISMDFHFDVFQEPFSIPLYS